MGTVAIAGRGRVAVLAIFLAAAAFAQTKPRPDEAAAPPGAAACSGCHSARIATAIPSLRGRSPDEIAAAMQAFRDGTREATVMDRIAKGFTDEESRAIAAWVSQLH